MLQACADGSAYRLDKGYPEWKKICNHQELIEDECVEIPRKDAEATEDEWNKPFWECVGRDLDTGIYEMINNKERRARIEILNRALILSGKDYGPVCENFNGKDEYEYRVALDEDNTMRMITQLRTKYGIDRYLESVFVEEFGREMPSSLLIDYCNQRFVEYRFSSF